MIARGHDVRTGTSPPRVPANVAPTSTCDGDRGDHNLRRPNIVVLSGVLFSYNCRVVRQALDGKMEDTILLVIRVKHRSNRWP